MAEEIDKEFTELLFKEIQSLRKDIDKALEGLRINNVLDKDELAGLAERFEKCDKAVAVLRKSNPKLVTN